MLRPTRTAACVLLSALAFAGCGSSGSGDGAQDAATPAATTATAQATPDAAGDKQIATDALLTLDDFPAGWTQADELSESAATCEAVKAAKAAVSGRAAAPDFSQGENTHVSNTIYVFADEGTATKAYEGLAGEDTRLCLADQLSERLDDVEGIEVGDTSTAALSVDPLGDQREAARMTVPVTAEGVDAALVIDVVFIRVGRGISLNLFMDVPTPFDDDVRADLTAASAEHLSSALQ